MEFAYFLKLVKRNWIYILLFAIVAAGATFALLTLKPKQYYSKAQLSAGITQSNQVSLDKSQLSWSEVDNKFTNFLEFLHSKELFTMVGYRMLLLEIESNGAYKPEEFAEVKQKYSAKDLEVAKKLLKKKYEDHELLDLTKKDDRVINEMLKDMYYDHKILGITLNISRITGSDYFKIEVTTKNPILSSSLVNIFCEESIRLNTLYETQRAENSVKFFRELRDKKKEDLERKLDSLGKLKSGSNVVNFTTQSEGQIDQLNALETSRTDEEKRVTSLRRAIANVDAQLNQLEQRSNSANMTNNTIVNLKARMEVLNNRYINSGYKDRALADSLASLRLQLERQLGALTQNLQGGVSTTYKELMAKKRDYEIELSMAEASLNQINRNISSSRTSLTQFAGNEAALTPIEMAVNVAKEEYMQVVDRYNEARNEAMKNGAVLRQLEVGQPADEPQPAKRVMLSSVAGVASIVISLSVLFMIAYFDSTIKNPDNFSKNTGLPLIGFISNLEKKSSNLESIFFDQNNTSPHSVKFKEQLRSIRYEIENDKDKVLLITSTDRDEGKSFAIVALAYSLILNYKKVLLIDTNFKHNTLSNLYRGQAEFEDFFTSDKKLIGDGNYNYSLEPTQKTEATRVDDLVHTTNIDGLDIISCKGNNLSPSEIFHGKRFEELLDRLRPRYDYIILEGPSLNLYSDTKELSSYSDKVIGVFAADKSIKQIDKVSIKYLKSLGDKYLGSILNKVDLEDLMI